MTSYFNAGLLRQPNAAADRRYLGLGETFESAETPIAGASTYTWAHGMSAAPRWVRVVMRCVADDLASAINAGQEIDVLPLWNASDGYPNCSLIADATNIILRTTYLTAGLEANVYTLDGGNNPAQVSSFNNFRLVAYAGT
jgi:hypothetical protein